ncbi:ABC transporter ATP-binding protein [Niveibacterium sp.]|uniref:ABC transporter ATP-binding protein n=1 Tax=Niveibacterium sp. TaxID=2017444 RepID=UPI0035ADDB0E
MSSDAVIKVERLSKCYQIYDKPSDRLLQMLSRGRKQYYREFWALRDVSFTVHKGEAVGIIGRNGSGKSTLLQLICGTLNPTSGSVKTAGRVAALLELGSGFNPEFTGRENVYMNGAVLGFDAGEISARFDEIAAFADIGDFIDQPVKTYSSGMLVRLAFAVQVCVQPEILVVDEALAVGDALFQKRCFERMEKLRSAGTTLLFVSHDQESVRTLTNRAILLRNGSVRAVGLSSEVLLEYRRQLHDDETRALNEAAQRLKEKAEIARAAQAKPTGLAGAMDVQQARHQGAVAETVGGALASDDHLLRSSRSFGDLDAEVLSVDLFNDRGDPSSHFDPRDRVRVVVKCVAHSQLTNLNVGLRIRNREGVKIYSWGTLNQDMAILAGLAEGEVFWQKEFEKGQIFSVAFVFESTLGPNLYEIQTSISQEGKPYYAEQRMLHWMDEAAFFTVTTNMREYHFGGVVDLRMASSFMRCD